jgi:hypothetical protein
MPKMLPKEVARDGRDDGFESTPNSALNANGECMWKTWRTIIKWTKKATKMTRRRRRRK